MPREAPEGAGVDAVSMVRREVHAGAVRCRVLRRRLPAAHTARASRPRSRPALANDAAKTVDRTQPSTRARCRNPGPALLCPAHMKGSLLLAEYATAHPDGTVSTLRSGITHIWGETAPVALQGMFVVRIEPDLGDAGHHKFDLRCIDEDGKFVLPPLDGSFDTPNRGGIVNFILGFGVQFPKFGRFEFVLRIDNVQRDTWVVTAAKHPVPQPPTADNGPGG